MPTILIADDHQLFRQGLRMLLHAEASFHLVGEAPDGLAAIDMAERLRPDVVTLDLMMPGLGGLEALHELRRRSPRSRVVILSMHNSKGYVLEALRKGAAGYVLKDSSADELVEAVKCVDAGQQYVSPSLREYLEDVYDRSSDEGDLDLYDTLTTREREVFHLAAEGCNNPQIASRLHISPRTAESHRIHAMRKLGLQSHTAVVRYAIRRGILPMES